MAFDMGIPPNTLDVRELDVVVADDEDICRAAAASSLKRFGFQAARVHEVESAEEVVGLLRTLQGGEGSWTVSGKRQVPLIVFLEGSTAGEEAAKSICALFQEKELAREPFLVCASSRLFHCNVPKTFEWEKLNHVFQQCRLWWSMGGGEPGKVKLQMEGSGTGGTGMRGAASGASKRASSATRTTSRSGPSNTLGKRGSVSAAKAQTVDALPDLDFSEDEDRMSYLRSGNSIECLDFLLPPRAPFEDVKLICLVGRGSFGRVYRARWDVATVALKVVEHSEKEATTMMAFEGGLSASLAHPNLVQTFKYSIRECQAGTAEEEDESKLSGFEVWIVQEWCGLGTLNAKIAKKELLSSLNFEEVIEVCAEISSAASYLHSRGIIHGDLTASNVLLAERCVPKGYTAKVTDFGLARILDSGASKIDTATMGTVTYMPPELFQLEGSCLTKKVDVYAFGVIMWQMCTGRPPFENLLPTQVVVMVASGATLELPVHVPPALAQVHKQCMSREPEERPEFDRIIQSMLKMMKLDSTTMPSRGMRRFSRRD
jgi:hypothetical protein